MWKAFRLKLGLDLHKDPRDLQVQWIFETRRPPLSFYMTEAGGRQADSLTTPNHRFQSNR